MKGLHFAKQQGVELAVLQWGGGGEPVCAGNSCNSDKNSDFHYLPTSAGNLLAFQAFTVIPHIAGDDKPC